MAINRRIVCTIATICILFRCVQAIAGKDFTVAQYIGIWYQVGLLLLKDPPNRGIMCEWFISESSTRCYGCFNETYQMLSDGRHSTRAYGIGYVIGPVVHVAYPTKNWTYTYDVTEYNDGDELILHEKGYDGNSKLLSRRTTASAETKAAFAEIAQNAGLRAAYIAKTSC